MKNRLSKKRRARGFTLMEILVVIALIGGILALVVVNFQDILGSNQADLEKKKVSANGGFDLALANYRMSVGSYPSSEEGLQALLAAPSGKEARWKPTGLKDPSVLTDSYGKPYGYRFPGTHNPARYDLWSFGPDGQDGTGDDIGNW